MQAIDLDPRLSPNAVPAVSALERYAPPRHPAPIDLKLDAGEADASLLVSRYPDARPLERVIAERLGIETARVVVTAGADDALDRACRALLQPGREIVLPVPTFEMLSRYARWSGATVREASWPEGPYPLEAVLAEVNADTAVIAVVSPNNPTGAIATADDLACLSRAAPHALLLVDLAYVEFADEDLTEAALALPNALVTRTLSKAWGLAGLRVGYAAGPERVVGWLRSIGLPYPVATPSLASAERALTRGAPAMRARVAAVRSERERLRARLEALGMRALASQANFVLARSPRSSWLADALAGLGIGVRAFRGEDAVRISCPGNAAAFARLEAALEAALAPEALLFDMDGVLADVSRSYHQAIVATAASFGAVVGAADIAAEKAAGDANNDWLLTQRLCRARGIEVPLAAIVERFEAAYASVAQSERLLVPSAVLDRLAARMPLAVVTGRPRAQAERFLADQGIADRFTALVCMEDGPAKPDPAPVIQALAALGLRRAWMIGDTPDDVRAARAAGVVPIGFAHSPAVTQTLLASGAARVVSDLADLEELLP